MTGQVPSARKRQEYVDPVVFTPHFSWRSAGDGTRTDAVCCEGVSLPSIAEKFATPTYVYSRAAIRDAFHELERGVGKQAHTLCFAVKSNGNLSILQHLAKLGSGFDVVSGGELFHLQHIGVPGNRVVFSGVGKTKEEIREALQYPGRSPRVPRGILLFNVESEAELDVLFAESARQLSRGAAMPSASIRVNPDVAAGGHPHISTGHHGHKFGLDWSAARRLYLAHRDSKWMHWQGISAHIGSQITSLAPFQSALQRLSGFFLELHHAGIALRYFDVGGGLGVRYTDQKPPSRIAYARHVARVARALGAHLLLEPGRTIIAAAGILLTRVLYVKENRGKRFVIVDAGMNDLMRPALYGAVHAVTAVTHKAGGSSNVSQAPADIVGPVCETGDCFLRDWPLGPVKAGDLLAIWSAGAYGMSLASNYNARGRPAEVLVNGKRAKLIRSRESPMDLLRSDVLVRGA